MHLKPVLREISSMENYRENTTRRDQMWYYLVLIF